MRLIPVIFSLLLTLCAIEGFAYWWMHPAPADLAAPVLTYHPSAVSPSTTPLPEVYRQAAPVLRCSCGQVFHTHLENEIGIHFAYFEWDGTDTGSVLEAFRHLPEACMGSLGMTLVSRETPIRYPVGNTTLVFDHTIFHEAGQGGGVGALGPLVTPSARYGWPA